MAKWQMPHGGIDAGETPREAALRELLEEIGTRRCHPHPDPPPSRGREYK